MSAAGWAIVLGALIGVVLVFTSELIFLENSSRIAMFPRTRRLSAVVVVVAVGSIFVVVSIQTTMSGSLLQRRPTTRSSPVRGASPATVAHLVAISNGIHTVPRPLIPSVSEPNAGSSAGVGFPPVWTGCRPADSESRVPPCVFGDRHGAFTMLLYGDSHAGMWFQALDDIALHVHWRLVVLFKPACLASPLSTHAPGVAGDWLTCDRWHAFAINRINRVRPNLLIVSQASFYDAPDGDRYTPAQWQSGLSVLLRRLSRSTARTVVLGNLPPSEGPDCVARHTSTLQVCSTSVRSAVTPYKEAERRAAAAQGVPYVDVTPWFCAEACSAIIGHYQVYTVGGHVATGYSRFLEGVLEMSLAL